ncbi:hypothetical protein VaNZ11_008337, partial [Volvox africanus]
MTAGGSRVTHVMLCSSAVVATSSTMTGSLALGAREAQYEETQDDLSPSVLPPQLSSQQSLTVQAETADPVSVLGSGATQPRPLVVIVTGPTAVGKTAISLMLAQRLTQPQRQQPERQGVTDRGAGDEVTGISEGSHAEAGGSDVDYGREDGGLPTCPRGEVISADSVQIYRGLDVGSDKLPPDERRGVPHHLIDVRDALEDFSAGEFFECARPVLEDIVRRGGVPLVVGGTGLYLRWLVVGKGGAPKAKPEILAAVEAALKTAWEAAEAEKRAAANAAAATDTTPIPTTRTETPAGVRGDGCTEVYGACTASLVENPMAAAVGTSCLTEDDKWEAAAALLLKWGDEVAYERIRAERNNYYRLERALSILLMHPGSRLADFEPRADPNSGPDFDFRCFFLHRPRLQLYDRIAARVEEMILGGGLLEEAAMLLRRGLTPGSNMAAKAIGYRQAMEWLIAAKAAGRPVGLADLCMLHGAICQATHKLVRSQMTWFRDDPLYKWIDVDGRDPEDVVAEILREVAKPRHEGGCGDSGRLSKEEQKAVMRYKPQLKLLTDANAKAAATLAAAAPVAPPPPPPPQVMPTDPDLPLSLPPPPRPVKPKSKAALAAEAAAAVAAAAEAQLAPLLARINEELL